MYTLSNAKIKKLVHAVQSSLSDDLRKPQYRGHENCLAGHCYVASEALFHLLGGAESGWVPQSIQHEGGPHWYLKHKISGTVLDPTASQFKTKVPYEHGRGKGFLTKQPSKRAQVVLDRLKNEGLDLPVQKSEGGGSLAFLAAPKSSAPNLVYRGMTHGEHEYIRQNGHILSDQRYCVSGEGTCFASDHDAAESYVNTGHTNPISTKSHTYVIGVEPHGLSVDRRDGYHKTSQPIPSHRIKSITRYNPDGTMEAGAWHPEHGFVSSGPAVPHPWRKDPIQWGIRKSEDLAKGVFAQAAFRHKATGQVTATGSFHDLEQVPDFSQITHDEGFVDHQGQFFTREEAKVALERPHTVMSEHLFEDSPHRKWRQSAFPEEFDPSFKKNHPSPVFPKLGVPDDRRETMTVGTQQSAALKIRQLANATRNAVRSAGKVPTRTVQQSNEKMAQLYGKAHGASSSHGPTINSYALGDALRNNPRPKDSISTGLHEDVHNIFKRIQLIHGEKARHHLARNLMVHMRAIDPEYHAAVHDVVNVRNGSEFLKRTPVPAEEAFAHTIDFLNNPRERERFHNRKKHSPEEARAFDTTMKRGYQKLRHLAMQASPDWLMQKSDANPAIPDMPSDHCQAFVVAESMVRQCKKPVKASGLCYLHLSKIGHFFEIENEKQNKKVEVSSVAVFNSEGYLLMGIRNDSNKWTLPGGKADDGESPETCAHRELWEEAGIKIKSLESQGSGWGGKNGDVKVSVFRGQSDDSPSSENDPDKEVDEWEWIDVREGLPKEVRENLHNGKHDITLQILGLLEGGSNVELSKSWKHAFVGAMTAASLSTAPALAQDAVTNDHHEEWTPNGLHEELKPIAHLESNFGQKIKHAPHSKGEYHTAFGAVGLKGITAHEEYKRTKYLQQIYPDLHDQDKFMDAFKSNPHLYNAVATAHWARLKKLFGGDVQKTAFAWRWGQGKAAKTDPEMISASPYVQGYERIWQGIRGQHVALVNPLEKKVQDWLSKSMDRPTTQRVILYDLEDDPFGHMDPVAKHTEHGTFYEAQELDEVVQKLKRLGYHGYHRGGEQILFPEYESLASTIH